MYIKVSVKDSEPVAVNCNNSAVLVDISGGLFGPVFINMHGMNIQTEKHCYWLAEELANHDQIVIELLDNDQDAICLEGLTLPKRKKVRERLSFTLDLGEETFALDTTDDKLISVLIESHEQNQLPQLALKRGESVLMEKTLVVDDKIIIRVNE